MSSLTDIKVPSFLHPTFSFPPHSVFLSSLSFPFVFFGLPPGRSSIPAALPTGKGPRSPCLLGERRGRAAAVWSGRVTSEEGPGAGRGQARWSLAAVNCSQPQPLLPAMRPDAERAQEQSKEKQSIKTGYCCLTFALTLPNYKHRDTYIIFSYLET